MKFRNLGRTGLKVSELCMGTMQFGWTADEASSMEVLDASFKAGINFYDTADVYSRWVPGNPGGISEGILGNWMSSRKIPRHQLVIATKVRGQMSDDINDRGLSRQHIIHSVENSLKRLKTDYIDLYQAHSVDPETPIDETMHAFDDLIRQGKVRYIGCSNYPASKLVESLWVSDVAKIHRYDCIQPNYSLLNREEFERETAEVCQKFGIGVIPYSPLARGFLTGKYRKGKEIPKDSRGFNNDRIKADLTDKNFELLDLMDHIGAECGDRSTSQVALAWLLADPIISSPIIGPKNLDQLNDNLAAVEFSLEAEQREQLSKATEWKV